MTLTELKYIVAVARERHFGKAAEACYVSQPTLSVAVKKLEEELDVKLFERSANEVSVTPLGEAVVRQAQSVLEQAAVIYEIAQRGKDSLFNDPAPTAIHSPSLRDPLPISTPPAALPSSGQCAYPSDLDCRGSNMSRKRCSGQCAYPSDLD